MSARASSTKWASARPPRRLGRSIAAAQNASSSWRRPRARGVGRRGAQVLRARAPRRQGAHDSRSRLLAERPGAGLLVSYEMAVKWADYLKDDVIDALIFDECHYLKNADTARALAAREGLHGA